MPAEFRGRKAWVAHGDDALLSTFVSIVGQALNHVQEGIGETENLGNFWRFKGPVAMRFRMN